MRNDYFKKLGFLLICLIVSCFGVATSGTAMPGQADDVETYRGNCVSPEARAVMNINSTRTNIFSGGEVWRDYSGRGYVVPDLGPTGPTYGLFDRGGISLGGIDEVGNLRVAVSDYIAPNRNDWWPGPIEESGVKPDFQTCRDWDHLFEVRFEDMETHRINIRKYIENGLEYPTTEIPDRIKYWPGDGNPFFSDKYGFELPNLTQGLAPFYDYSGNGIYNPAEGDFPVLGGGTCEATENSRIPDQMFFWILTMQVA